VSVDAGGVAGGPGHSCCDFWQTAQTRAKISRNRNDRVSPVCAPTCARASRAHSWPAFAVLIQLQRKVGAISAGGKTMSRQQQLPAPSHRGLKLPRLKFRVSANAHTTQQIRGRLPSHPALDDCGFREHPQQGYGGWFVCVEAESQKRHGRKQKGQSGLHRRRAIEKRRSRLSDQQGTEPAQRNVVQGMRSNVFRRPFSVVCIVLSCLV